MRPFEMLKYEDTYVEIMFQLPCMSLTPKTWIPVDRKIQSRVWECSSSVAPVLDGICYLIFKICWSIFKSGYFTAQSKKVMNSLLGIIDMQTFKELAELVFFNYSNTLITLLTEERFDEIIPSYFAFREY